MIGIVIGTNAELIKTFPVMKELEKRDIDYTFIHSGQHDLEKTCKLFDIKSPDVTLTKPPEKSSKFFTKTFKAIVWNLFLVPRIRKSLKEIEDLDYVIYHGDTMTTASAAIASSKFLNWGKDYGNVHLEAGLRSGSLMEPFPEELSRRICDKFSDILLAVSDGTEKNLKDENQKGEILKAGNTIVDSIYLALEMRPEIKIPKEDYCLVNSHRHENIKSKDRMEKIVEIIESSGIKVLWPIHDNTKKKLEDYNLWKRIEKNDNIETMSLVSYVDFIHLIDNCTYLITDGGSIQEESLELKKPCILLRDRTERVEGLDSGLNFLTNLDVKKAKKIIKRIESGKVKPKKGFKNPYGEKEVSKKIVGYLVRK